MKKIKVYTDATAKGNPGPSGLGIVIKDEADEILLTHKQYIGKATNNQGEYTALLESLKLLRNLNTEYDFVEFYSDSLLMVSQLTGKYKIKDKIILNLLTMSHLLHFFLGGLLLIFKISIMFALLGYAVRMGVVMAVGSVILGKLQQRSLRIWLPILDGLLVLYYLVFAPSVLMNNDDTQRWN